MQEKNDAWLKQIPPEVGYYLAGFADGEGSFIVSLRQRPDHTLGWQVVLTFNVAQKESYILSQFKRYLGCGRIQERKDGICYYVCANPQAIQEKVIPFFQRFEFRSQRKKKNFAVFCRIAEKVFKKEHLTQKGLNEIIRLREELNHGRGRTRKFILKDFENFLKENPQRLHAKPRRFRKEPEGGRYSPIS